MPRTIWLIGICGEGKNKGSRYQESTGCVYWKVVVLLSKDFVVLVLVAIVIAFPFSGWIMNKWLDGFAYRIEITFPVFLITGLLVVFVALVTVAVQGMKAARVNPVKSLKTE